MRTIAKAYYVNYEKLRLDVKTLPEVGVEILKRKDSDKHYYNAIVIGKAESARTGSIDMDTNTTGVAARLHFHWTSPKPSEADVYLAQQEAQTFDAIEVGNYQEWIATYTREFKFFPSGVGLERIR